MCTLFLINIPFSFPFPLLYVGTYNRYDIFTLKCIGVFEECHNKIIIFVSKVQYCSKLQYYAFVLDTKFAYVNSLHHNKISKRSILF